MTTIHTPNLTLPALIACVDSSEDVLLLLRDRMVDAGYRAVTFCSPISYGSQPVIDFVTYLAPQVVISSVSPPYRESWEEYQALKRAVPEIPHLAATTNRAALERVIGPTDAFEVLCTEGDLEPLVAEIQRRLAPPVVPSLHRDGTGIDHHEDGDGWRARLPL